MANINVMITLIFVAIVWVEVALGHEPSPLQDFCVADFSSTGNY